MATIRAYTTIEQSCKLAEFLPIESADMWYHGHYSPWESERKYDDEPCPFHGVSPSWDKPCWSLGALLELLKTRKYCNFLTLHSSRSLKWILTTSYYELANWKEKETIGETQIEAVYSMVVWLLENGLF